MSSDSMEVTSYAPQTWRARRRFIKSCDCLARDVPHEPPDTRGKGSIGFGLRACVPAATLPNVPDMNWQNVMRPTAGECSRIRGKFVGRCHAWGGGVGSRCVAACGRQTPLVAGRRAWRAGIVWRLDRSGRGLGSSIRNATGGHSQRPAACASATSPPIAGTPPGGAIAACDVGTSVRSSRQRVARVSGRRSHAHHRSRLRPQQGAGNGADAARRGLLARLFP